MCLSLVDTRWRSKQLTLTGSGGAFTSMVNFEQKKPSLYSLLKKHYWGSDCEELEYIGKTPREEHWCASLVTGSLSRLKLLQLQRKILRYAYGTLKALHSFEES